MGPDALEGLERRVPDSRQYARCVKEVQFGTHCPSQDDLESRPLRAASPLALRRTDGHAIWVSHSAMAQTLEQLPGKRWPDNKDIDGGEIILDGKGDPTGRS